MNSKASKTLSFVAFFVAIAALLLVQLSFVESQATEPTFGLPGSAPSSISGVITECPEDNSFLKKLGVPTGQETEACGSPAVNLPTSLCPGSERATGVSGTGRPICA